MLRPAIGLALLLGLSASIARAAAPATAPAEVIARLQLLSATPVACVSSDQYRVLEWVEDRSKQNFYERWSTRPVDAATIVQLSSGLFAIEENHSGQWLIGEYSERDHAIVCSHRFDNLESFYNAGAYAKLPDAAMGWSVRELARFTANPTRMADDGSGKCLYVLCSSGDVYKLALPGGHMKKVLDAQTYAQGQTMAIGLALDAQRRMFLVVNVHDTSPPIHLNRVTIYRTDPVRDGEPIVPKAWLKTEYPWGVDVFNHGVGHVAFGPDGMLYVASGSRTDSNEPGNDPHISKDGETPITACIWRLDPRSESPKIEIFADGLRNPYGFCWDDRGQMWATDNGPNEDPPEELNRIEHGKHYGFPYQFSDWLRSPYPHTPKTPDGMKLELPVVNLGPDGGGSATRPISTFDPHSSPTGIVYLGNDFPESCRGSFLIPRFGPLLDKPEVGFDVLLVTVHSKPRADGRIEAEAHRLLYPVARPVDVHVANGKVYLCEFSRETKNGGSPMTLPGRLLELKPPR